MIRQYRGKRIDNGEWVYGDLIRVPRDMGQDYWDPPSSELVTYITNSMSIRREWVEIQPDTIGQHTGRKDKNGVEIYEGSQVVAKKPNSGLGDMNDIYQVEWSEQYNMYVLKCIRSDNPYRVGRVAEKGNNQPFLLSNIIEVINE